MERIKGVSMITIGAMLWGITGPLLEWILKNTAISVQFLLAVRLSLAGGGLLFVLYMRNHDIYAVWKYPVWRKQLIVFSILGMLGLQYTFVAAIDASNAVVATLLQFSAPIIIVFYVSITYKRFPPRYQITGILGTLIGLFFLLTNGSLEKLMVSPNAVLWGIGLGIAFTIYTLYPARLMSEWSTFVIVGWSMLIGGITLAVFTQIWQSDEWPLLAQPEVVAILFVIIIFSTLAFVLFLNSLKYITAVETSILSSIEPLTAMLISVVWFHTILQKFQLLGILMMLIFVTWLSIGSRTTKRSENNIKELKINS